MRAAFNVLSSNTEISFCMFIVSSWKIFSFLLNYSFADEKHLSGNIGDGKTNSVECFCLCKDVVLTILLKVAQTNYFIFYAYRFWQFISVEYYFFLKIYDRINKRTQNQFEFLLM